MLNHWKSTGNTIITNLWKGGYIKDFFLVSGWWLHWSNGKKPNSSGSLFIWLLLKFSYNEQVYKLLLALCEFIITKPTWDGESYNSPKTI